MSWLDPRLSARYTVRDGTTVKGGAGLYHQPPQPVYLTHEWGNPELREEGAWHYMAGVEQRIAGPLTADVQLYYKRLFDLVLPTGGTERYVNGGTGRSYGAELLLRWNPGGRFFGWLAYSLSRSERDQKVIGGTIMPNGDAFDQPHNLTALGTLELPELWEGFSAGFRVRYATGNPYRRTVGGRLRRGRRPLPARAGPVLDRAHARPSSSSTCAPTSAGRTGPGSSPPTSRSRTRPTGRTRRTSPTTTTTRSAAGSPG